MLLHFVDGNELDSLYQVRLLSALRSGDPARIHPFLTDITKDRRTSAESDTDLGAAALHLAIRCASCDTISLLSSHRSISPNAVYPPGSGTTALHLAASLSRTDVVNLLLEQEGIDDSLRDSQGKTCLEVAKGKDTVRAIRDSRAILTASYRSLLRSYILSSSSAPPTDALIQILSSPRIRLVDLSYLDDSSGRTLLHEAARRKDLRLVELAVRAGADVFVRDRKGRPVYDSAGKDDRVRVFLRQFTNQDNSLIAEPSTSLEPPELRGYLNKYTNVARGYNTRWFILHQGVLSYYRHQEDENLACRGSISLRHAILTVPTGTSGLRFEVHSTPSRGHSSIQKWYLKANHPVEASRWITAIQKSMELAKRDDTQSRKSGDSEAPSLKPSLSISGATRRRHTQSTSGASGVISATSSQVDGDSGGEAASERRDHDHQPSFTDTEGDQDHGDSSDSDSVRNAAPHANSFELQGNSLIAQTDLAAQLFKSTAQSSNSLRAAEVHKALGETLGTVSGMLNEYVQMVKEREEWYKSALERERERQNVWEASLQAVVREGDMLEKELRSRIRRRSRAPSDAQNAGTLRRLPSPTSTPEIVTAPAVAIPHPDPAPAPTPVPPAAPFTQARDDLPSPAATISARGSNRRTSLNVPVNGRPFSLIMGAGSASAGAIANGDEDDGDTTDEDEFFDAIESGNLPGLVITRSLIQQNPSATTVFLSPEVYAGYTKLRDRLGISTDDRPPMSLWAVLKNSIGKDLTKISFPVFFNEPTSMLQRMAEDMEFSECLDAAYAETDQHKRIAFVAAFAMSNYSSTIGRIAKPFNPMLSETFEYVRHDKQYRYVSEQVSHHPPISACWAEAPTWRYYGEVDAQNKFMGKSFEIRPTGIAHAELLLPEDREGLEGYPKARGVNVAGRVVEHYSWKKVTTNVSGFILGSPTIDHYGDMVITNHRTKDRCVLTFKPRGWRGRDAYEISGYVSDAEGNVVYEIAGRWNSQLVARRVGTGVGQLHPDVAPASEKEYILLWRNSEKPTFPFNLTPFAITLNDCPPDTLRPYVCPTDCRMRPDQRAFELGKYERANDLKIKQEEFQRATRKAREEGSAPAHGPRWFAATTEPDTGERVWMPAMAGGEVEYWAEREKVWKATQDAKGAAVVSWKGVEPIFIDDEP
ncbi:Oxysterol-binding protein-domain-containing protein [Epithele typhae]|uniref:Oxysterol-binding protein-domain-containing protein n=1 Tax=Epithele typhae TaxID=378194 RepID=UPI0020088F2E|nr:Oxysterol-binding protein-domain-containing protein [Epithele typhae]KAH9920538.1 Oxysterol-binding protein-domain-containing protein [Epithele typhae]